MLLMALFLELCLLFYHILIRLVLTQCDHIPFGQLPMYSLISQIFKILCYYESSMGYIPSKQFPHSVIYGEPQGYTQKNEVFKLNLQVY